jgi:hypothetical protein
MKPLRTGPQHGHGAVRPTHQAHPAGIHEGLLCQPLRSGSSSIRTLGGRDLAVRTRADLAHAARGEAVGKQHDVADRRQALGPVLLAAFDLLVVVEQAAAAMQRDDCRKRPLALRAKQQGGKRPQVGNV